MGAGLLYRLDAVTTRPAAPGAAGHPVTRRTGVTLLPRQNGHLDASLLSDGQDTGVDGCRRQARVVGVDFGPPDRAGVGPRHLEQEALADVASVAGQGPRVGQGGYR